MASSPIADLSYRNYDGPLEAPTFRWWVVAKMTMGLAIKKKGFWIWSCLSAYWYLILGAIYYFVDVISDQSPQGGFGQILFSQTVWKDKFLDAFSISQILLFIVALLVGIGTIANDNRANALLVYLSKPCTKLDYLAGKWMAIFLLLLAVSGIPMLLFYGYCYMSFRQYGFVSQDPLLIWKLLAIMPLPAALHASLCVGISSMFQQGRLAGATYAALYFITWSFTNMMKLIILIEWADETPRQMRRHMTQQAVSHSPAIVHSLFYASVDGIQIGLAKVILGTQGSPVFPNPGGGAPPMPHIPDGYLFGAIYLLVCAGSLLIAWTRIRAVEVVSS